VPFGIGDVIPGVRRKNNLVDLHKDILDPQLIFYGDEMHSFDLETKLYYCLKIFLRLPLDEASNWILQDNYYLRSYRTKPKICSGSLSLPAAGLKDVLCASAPLEACQRLCLVRDTELAFLPQFPSLQRIRVTGRDKVIRQISSAGSAEFPRSVF
jgi:hypothetical protein